MKTKKDRTYSFNHTKKRIKERYNITELTSKQYDYMCEKILKSSGAIFIKAEMQEDDTQKIYDLEFTNRDPIRVVWSETRQCITTVLER